MNFRRIVREPLLQFLLICRALFMLYGKVNSGDSGSRAIAVSKGDVKGLRHQNDILALGKWSLAISV